MKRAGIRVIEPRPAFFQCLLPYGEPINEDAAQGKLRQALRKVRSGSANWRDHALTRPRILSILSK